MKLIFDDMLNVTVHMKESSLKILDNLAKKNKTSRNKLILKCVEYALADREFVQYIKEEIARE